jgi:adenosylmethionine---8-amino-7-oxononanoate aminotransferase
MYEPEPLRKLIATCRSSEIVIISDEVMTGFGRTGKIFAGSYFEGMADVACFSKGLTGGFIPLGLTTATGEIFSAFLSEERKRMFLHGHSFSGNPIGCAAALGNLEVFKSGKSLKNIKRVSDFMMEFCGELEKTEGALNPRCLGTILAFEVNDPGADYFSDMRNRIYDFFMERGVFIRPLGNVIYLLPPYCISDKSLEKIRRAVLDFLISLRES